MNLQDRHGARWRKIAKVECSGHRCDGRYDSRALRGEAMREDRTVGVASRVDAIPVDTNPLFEVSQQGGHESDVVDRIRQRIPATTITGIPGEEPVRKWSGAIRVHDEEAFPIRHAIQFRISLEAGRVAATTMERQQDWDWRVRRHRRHVHEVRASSSTVTQVELMIA
jgi:hypothetical protein